MYAGSYAISTEKEALDALNSAKNAYDKGRVDWPTRGVKDRIKCLERFVHKIAAKKDLVTKLIMW